MVRSWLLAPLLLLGAAQVDDRWRTANAQYLAGQHAAALESLRALAGRTPPFEDPANLSFLIARCLDQLGRAPEAVAEYERFLALAAAHPPEAPDAQASAALRVQNVRSRLVVLVPATFGRVEVRCDDPGLTIALDDDRAPCPATFERQLPRSATARVLDGERTIEARTIEIRPGPATAVAIGPLARVAVESDVVGEVSLNGRRLGSTPLAPLRVPSGAATLRFAASGYPLIERSVELKAGQLETVRLTLLPNEAPAGSGSQALAWSLTIAGAALAVGGGVTLGLAADRHGAAEGLHDDYTRAADPTTAADLRRRASAAFDDRDLYVGAGVGLLGAAAVAGAIATWAWLDDDGPSVAWSGRTVWWSASW